MKDNHRMIFAVVAAEAHSIEQRKIIKGIVGQAQKYNIDIVVISNVYNPYYSESDFSFLSCENTIYDLILSPDIDGIIVISESFLNKNLFNHVKENVIKSGLPAVIIGTNNDIFKDQKFRCINTDDAKDIEDITDHLIEVHGFDKIDILTGGKDLEVSEIRVDGYRNSLEKHGIKFDKNRVYYGDFWMNSGEELAEKYCCGEISMPQALVCTNDYMAFGFIDKLQEKGIKVPEEITVVGYEYVGERQLHSPMLTTYQRNRAATGEAAVNILYNSLINGEYTKYTPLKGNMILGRSCPCHPDEYQVLMEMKNARKERDYYNWNLYNQMEQQLTACRILEEFIDTAGKYEWNIRDVKNIFLCLSQDWYMANSDKISNNITCRSIIPWFDHTPFTINRLNISEILSASDKAEVYYFTPLFFNDRPMGYVVLKYDKPDTYDGIYRNWLKSVSNGLEFLRMKNDISSLLECQNLSSIHDSVSGLYNENGIKKELDLTCRGMKEDDKILLLLFKTNIFSDGINIDKRNINVHLALEVAEVMKSYMTDDRVIYGRMNENLYAIAVKNADNNTLGEILSDKLSTVLMHSPEHIKNCEHDSIVIKYKTYFVKDFEFDKCVSEIRNQINEAQCQISARYRQLNYREYYNIRNRIYKEPLNEWSIENECRKMNHSMGYFRTTYKKLFEISFHQDVICSRISYAKFLILTTQLSLGAIAIKCGYEDEKYFFRQFKMRTGITPNKYKYLT